MANTKFQFKRTTVSGRLPNTTNSGNTSYIDSGEFAINLTDYKVVSSNGTATFEVGANLSSLNLTGALTANGSNGSAGQVLTTNSTGTYWSTVSGGSGPGVNTDAQYTWTNTHTYTKGTVFSGNASLTANGTVGSSGQVLTTNGSGLYWAEASVLAGGNTIIATGTGSNQSITLSSTSIVANDIVVTVNGLRQTPTTSYIVTAGTLYITAPSGSEIVSQLVGGPPGAPGGGGVNTDAQYTWTNTHTYTKGTVFSSNASLTANGTIGTIGQILTSNGNGLYWSTSTGGGLIAGNGLTSNATHYSVLANTGIVANTTGTFLNTTYVTGLTVNAANFLGNSSGTVANIASWITGNAATAYSNAVANAAALYQTTVGLSANVATLTSNNSTNFGGLSLATVQGQITGNAATAYSNAVANAAALYQTTAGLSANVATLTSNNSTNFGGLSLATVQGQITGNASTAYTNAITIAANATNLTSGTVGSARLGSGTANSTTVLYGNGVWSTVSGGGGSPGGANTQIQFNDSSTFGGSSDYTFDKSAVRLTVGNSTVNTTINSTAIVLKSLVANGTIGTTSQILTSNGTSLYWSTPTGGGLSAGNGLTSNTTHYLVLANTGIVANTTGTFLDTSYTATLTVNAANFLGNSSGSIANIASWITGNAATAYSNAVANAAALYQTTAGLSANVATLTSNNSTNFGGLSLATVQGQITGNAATAYSNAVANAAALYQTTAGLSANVATLTSNNSTNFGGLSLATVQGQITGNASTAYTNAITIAANATNLTSGTLGTARLASGTANSTTYLRGDQTWVVLSGGASPGGANTQIQFNDSGAFGASSDYTFDKSAVRLTVGNTTVNTTVNSTAIVLKSLVANGTIGTNSQILTSNGTGLYWSTPTGGGLSAGNGLTSNATHYSVLANTGIIANATGTFLDTTYTSNASNLTTGTLPNARLTAQVVNTSGTFSISGIIDHTANLVITGNSTAMLSVGNNSTSNVFINATSVLVQSTSTVGSVLSNSTVILIGNSTVNSTINSTAFSGTSNNATNLGGVAASGYQTTAGLSANVATLTSNNATNLGGVAASGYQTAAGLSANVATLTSNNATNLGGVAAANYVNTSGSYTITGVHTMNANLFVNTATLSVGNTTSNVTTNTTNIVVGNSTVNVSINSTAFSGTSNNATNLGGVAAASYVNTSGTYTITGVRTMNANLFVNSAILSVGNTTANVTANTTELRVGNSTVNVSINSTAFSGTANNATNLGGVAASGYQTTAGLSANVATLTSNNATNLGGVAASGYQTTAGLSANVATLTSNNSTNFGGLSLATVQGQITGNASTAYTNAITIAANATNLTSGTVGTARLASGTANSTTYLRGDQTWAVLAGGTSPGGTNTQIQFNDSGAFGGSSDYTFDKVAVRLTVGNTTVNTVANSTVILIGNSTVNTTINSTAFSGTSNNATNLGGVAAASYVNTSGTYTITGVHTMNANLFVNTATLSVGNTTANITANTTVLRVGNSTVNVSINSTAFSGTANNATNLGGVAASGYQTTAGLSANVATLTSNNSTNLGGVAASGYQTTAGLSANVATLTSNNSTNLGGVAASGYQTTAGLSANVATLTSNNATNLGGVAASGYQTTAGLSANVATLTSNNSTNFGGLSLATVQGQITGNASTAYTNAITIAANATNLTSGTVGTARLASGTANSTTVLYGNSVWAVPAGGGGATLTANNTDTQTFYIPMANTTSGSWSNAVISTTKMYFTPSSGTLNATVFNSLSDRNVKTNIKSISSALDTVRNLNGVSFNWKDNGGKSYGVIAQEVEAILPDLVSNTDPKSVNYSGIIAFLINAIKELDEEVQKNKCTCKIDKKR